VHIAVGLAAGDPGDAVLAHQSGGPTPADFESLKP